MNSQQIANILKSKGFDTQVKGNEVIVSLNRKVSRMEVQVALINEVPEEVVYHQSGNNVIVYEVESKMSLNEQIHQALELLNQAQWQADNEREWTMSREITKARMALKQALISCSACAGSGLVHIVTKSDMPGNTLETRDRACPVCRQ